MWIVHKICFTLVGCIEVFKGITSTTFYFHSFYRIGSFSMLSILQTYPELSRTVQNCPELSMDEHQFRIDCI